ncbi:BAR domain-containing protein [Orenia marismortui]|uniref:hypothetical protein n=1 Tax=Orenia marismortui TaxID=46469 RepID=UPI000369D1D0|nr:hypothetical protein [Orenia marismortui]
MDKLDTLKNEIKRTSEKNQIKKDDQLLEILNLIGNLTEISKEKINENNKLMEELIKRNSLSQVDKKIDSLDNSLDKFIYSVRNDFENKMNETKKQVENFYGNFIQMVAVVVAVFALIIGNIVSFSSLSANISLREIVGLGSLINGTILMGIFFLLIMIRKLFFRDLPKGTLILGIVPLLFFMMGFYFIA